MNSWSPPSYSDAQGLTECVQAIVKTLGNIAEWASGTSGDAFRKSIHSGLLHHGGVGAEQAEVTARILATLLQDLGIASVDATVHGAEFLDRFEEEYIQAIKTQRARGSVRAADLKVN